MTQPIRTLALARIGTVVFIAMFAAGERTSVQTQPQQWTAPDPPGERLIFNADDCDAQRDEWNEYTAELGKLHNACIEAKTAPQRPSAFCAKASCEQLHLLIFEFAAKERSRVIDECRAKVNLIDKQREAREEAVRSYNRYVATENRRLLDYLTQRDAATAQQDLRVQEAVAQRNRAAKARFDSLVREYSLNLSLADRASASLSGMRDALRGGVTRLSSTISGLVDNLGLATFGKAVAVSAEASATAGTMFDVLSRTHGYERPEAAASVMQGSDKVSAYWSAFMDGRILLTTSSSPEDRFNALVSRVSASTTYVFRATPWLAPRVADSIKGVGSWGNTLFSFHDVVRNGQTLSEAQIQAELSRAFPKTVWLLEKVTMIQDRTGQLVDVYGR